MEVHTKTPFDCVNEVAWREFNNEQRMMYYKRNKNNWCLLITLLWRHSELLSVFCYYWEIYAATYHRKALCAALSITLTLAYAHTFTFTQIHQKHATHRSANLDQQALIESPSQSRSKDVLRKRIVSGYHCSMLIITVQWREW